tara:strand:+ start:12026 stop:12925 length:900 start_codon:yes stop_codon:yes gene_type:complete
MKGRLSSLNLLRTFEVAGRHLSFTLAAQELCITTSAVSQQIRKLEEEVGAPLFERQPRGLTLSRRGKLYWLEVQTHILAIDRSTRAISLAPSIPLRVSLMPPLASRIVLPKLADFQALNPDIELHVDASLRYLDIAGDDADLAVRFGVPPWPGCQHEKLMDLYIQPVCPPALADRLQLSTHPENLLHAPLINMTNRPDSWTQYLSAAGQKTHTSTPQYFVDDYPAAIEAAETLGVALALAPLEHTLIEKNRLAAPWPASGPMPESIYAVIPNGSQKARQVQIFLEWLKVQLAQLPPVDG